MKEPGALMVTALQMVGSSAQKKAGTKADCLALTTAGSSAQKKAGMMVKASDNRIHQLLRYSIRKEYCRCPLFAPIRFHSTPFPPYKLHYEFFLY